MPHEIEWYQTGRVLRMRIWGTTTLEEVQQMGERYVTLVGEGQPPVHGLVDTGAIEGYPTNLAALRSALTMVNHPNIGWTLIVGSSTPLQRFITSMVTQLVIPRARFRMIDTMDDALNFLAHADATLGLTATSEE